MPLCASRHVLGVRALRTVVVALAIIATANSCRDSVSPGERRRTSLDLAVDTVELTYIGEARPLTATTRRGFVHVATPIAWSVNDPSVADVRQDGSVVARRAGITWLYAIADSGGIDSTVVRVRQAVARITVNPAVRSRPLLRTLQYSAAAFDAGDAPIDGVAFSWSSTNTAVADITPGGGLARALAVGTATIRATAAGITGEGRLTVSPLPSLRVSLDTIEVGVGQYPSGFTRPQPIVIADSLDPEENIVASVSIADPAIASAPSPINVPLRTTGHQPLTVTGLRAGVTRLTVCAPQYECGTAVVRVSTPGFVNSLRWNDPSAPTPRWELALGSEHQLMVSTVDSLGNLHHLAQPLTVTAVSSDEAVVRISTPSQVVAAGQVGASFTVTSVGIGTARVIVTAPGYRPDTVRADVVAERLRLHAINGGALSTMTVGVNQHMGTFHGAFITPSRWPPTGGLTFTLTQKHPELLRLPTTSITVASPRYPGAEFDMYGLAVGTDTIIASAPGLEPAMLVVHVTTPTYAVTGMPTEGYVVGSPSVIGVHAADSLGRTHFVASPPALARVTSSDPGVLRPRSELVEIPSSTGGGVAFVDHVGAGTATLTISDPAGIARPYTTPPITVKRSSIFFGIGGTRVTAFTTGQRQSFMAGSWAGLQVVAVHQGSARTGVSLRSSNPAIARPRETEAEMSGSGAFFDVVGGDVTGTAWLIAEGAGLIADSVAVTVTPPSLAVSRGPRDNELTVMVRDAFGNIRATAEALTLQVSSSDSTVLVPAVPTITIPAGSWEATVMYTPLREGMAVVRIIDPRATPYRYLPAASPILRIINAPE